MKLYIQPQISIMKLQATSGVCVIFDTAAVSDSPRVDGGVVSGGDEGLNGATIL